MHDNKQLLLSRVELQNFRCFGQLTLSFTSPLVLIEGLNGAGKTSILEALYYACYLRSFRTHIPKELIRISQDTSFIKVFLNRAELDHQIQVGFSHNKRLVKIDNKAVLSYKDLISYYKVISVTEDDLMLIKGLPQLRRNFLDQFILLYEPAFIEDIKKLRRVVESKNSILRPYNKLFTREMYLIWSEQLWELSRTIQTKRIEILAMLKRETNSLLHTHFGDEIKVDFEYLKKTSDHATFEAFCASQPFLEEQERRMHRSLYGAHVDDIGITFQGHKSKMFASRGQQKLILMLLKVAQVKLLTATSGPALLLIDDFIADFDEDRAKQLISILQELCVQIIITFPSQAHFLTDCMTSYGAQRLNLTY